MKTLSSEDLKKHNQISKPLNNLLSTAPIFIVFFTKGFWLTLVLAIAAFAFAALQTFHFNTKLKNAGLNNQFIKRLNYVTLLAGLSMILIFSGVCYEQFHA